MDFTRLDIYELVTEDDYARVAQYENVRVLYTGNIARAAPADGTGQIASLTTHDDDPVTIDSKGLKIEGTLDNREFGFWVLN